MLGLPWLQLRETAWEGLGAEEGVVRVTQPGVCVCMRVRVCVCVCVRMRVLWLFVRLRQTDRRQHPSKRKLRKPKCILVQGM